MDQLRIRSLQELLRELGAPLVGAQNMGAQNETVSAMNTVFPNETVFPNDMDDGRPQGHAPTVTQNISPTGKSVGDMLDAFKSITTVEYIRGVKTLGWEQFNRKLWQRNYYEHIIRDEQSYQRISDYIINNPFKWKDDKFYKQ